MSRTKMDDFRKGDGKIDWQAFHNAEVEAGDICQKCHTFILFAKVGPVLCGQCRKATEETEELWHDRFVRCPKCGYMWDPSETDDYHLMADGDHDAHCCECDHEFEMGTSISFSYKSPERIQEAEDELETVQETQDGEG